MTDPVHDRHARFINPGFVERLGTLGYARTFVRGDGAHLYDREGRAYLDLLASYGAAPLGHNPPALREAIERALDERHPAFLHVAPPVEQGLLAEALAVRLGPGLEVSFFGNSGAEAVEGALKLAYAATRRARVLYCTGGYHGMTLGALSLMGAARLRGPFPSLPGCDEIPFGALDALAERLRTRKYAALVVEPIFIEGGVRFAPDGYFEKAAELCRAAGTLLVFDEVQSGIGRTGTLFAFERLGMRPDVLCYAKALSGGLIPIGGFSTSMEWHRRAHPRTRDFDLHSSTFGGGALACAVARALLAIVDEPFLARVRERGEHLGARLADLARASRRVEEVRGIGLIHGVQMAPATRGLATALTLGLPNQIAARLFAHWVAVRLLERGFVTETTTHDERVLRVEPPLIIAAADLDRFVDALAEILDENDRFAAFVAQAGARLVKQWLSRGERGYFDT